MKNKILSLLIFLAACTKVPEIQMLSKAGKKQLALTTTTTAPDHVIFVWFENKKYSDIVGSTNAPFINSLIKGGTLFTNALSIGHPSYPNYTAWFSGSTQGITNDDCINTSSNTHATLYDALKSVGVSFMWYSETMPSNYYTGCSSSYYREKHNPTTIFKTCYNTCNKTFSASQWQDTNFLKSMPKVVSITPNMIHDFHDGSISAGDTWLKNSLGKYAAWAKTHNSILVIYYDESEGSTDYKTTPIPVTIYGQNIKAGIKITTKLNHYSFTKWVCSLYGASTSWASNVNNAITPTGF
jgi:hypothetical protein